MPAALTELSELPEIVHDGSRKTSLGRSVRELANERECVWAFAERYIRLRYKQAILGVGWAIIKPIALFLPFLVIDLVVASVTLSIGMVQLPPAMVSAPFKVLLFVLVDGWTLVVGSLLKSFYS